MIIMPGIMRSRKLSAWSPSLLTLSAWYDPSDLTTLFTDTAGTTQVTADSQTVARMNDKSGNGLHAIQSTASQRALFRTSGGLSWLEFDGSNDLYDIGTLGDFVTTSQFEYVIGGRFITVATDATNMNNDALFSDSTAITGFAYGRSSGAVGMATNDGGADIVQSSLSVGSDFVSQGRRISGTNYHSVNDGAEGSLVCGNLLSVAGTGQLGRGYDFSFCANARFYGGFFSKTVFSASDRASALTWMKTKAGVA